MRRITDTVGCTSENGESFCLDCCPDPTECEIAHGAIFVGSEWDCPGPSCDACLGRIEGPTILHGHGCDHVSVNA